MTITNRGSASQLPWPAGWSTRTGKWRTVVGFVALLSVAMVLVGILAVLNGDYGVGFVLLLASPLLFAVTVFGWVTRLRLRRRGATSIGSRYVPEIGEEALAIPYSRAVTAATWGLLAAMIGFWGVLAVVSGLGVVASPDVGDLPVLALFVFSALATLFALVLAFTAVRGRFARAEVALSPAGVHHRSLLFVAFFPWESLASISAGDLAGPLIRGVVPPDGGSSFRRTSRLWKQAELRLAPHLAIQAKYLAVDPALAFHALRYYHEHPEARPELGTPSAADRVRRADLR